MRNIVWSRTATRDLDDIVSWSLANYSTGHASSFVDTVDASLLQIADHPDSGRVIPELARQNITKYREIVLAPWRLWYSTDRDLIIVHAVIDGRRNVEDLLLRRNLR